MNKCLFYLSPVRSSECTRQVGTSKTAAGITGAKMNSKTAGLRRPPLLLARPTGARDVTALWSDTH
eukprot:12301995-Alexandrium_andersonii.AAC.1